MANELVTRFSGKYGISENEVLQTLKQTCFQSPVGSPPVTDAQMTALLVVADKYCLNPFLKEIYAFPDKRGGIIPIVSIDGWLRIVNEHPMFNGVSFLMEGNDFKPDSIECTLYRKDRDHPIKITEYFSECVRPTDPWKTHPKRMLRHKAFIQCARVAFGFGGIYDQDEGERILEKDITPRPVRDDPAQLAIQAQDIEYTDDRDKLLADLDAVADNGTEALKTAWERLTKEQRRSIGKLPQSTYDRASASDDFARGK